MKGNVRMLEGWEHEEKKESQRLQLEDIVNTAAARGCPATIPKRLSVKGKLISNIESPMFKSGNVMSDIGESGVVIVSKSCK